VYLFLIILCSSIIGNFQKLNTLPSNTTYPGVGYDIKPIPPLDENLPKFIEEVPPPKGLIKEYDEDCVRKLARSYIGVREIGGNNRGEQVESFWLRFLPNAKNARYAWCTFFVNHNLDSCGIDNPRNGWTPNLATYKNATILYQRGKNKPITAYESNLVMTLYYANLKREGHSGHVVDITNSSYVTVEGNTTMNGTRESYEGKDGVRELWRPKSTIYRIIKYGE